MKTDNNNISNSLEEATKEYQNNQDNHFLFPNDKSAFKAGANWQKEQYKDLVQSHAELLETLNTIKSISDNLHPNSDFVRIWNIANERIKKANKITQP